VSAEELQFKRGERLLAWQESRSRQPVALGEPSTLVLMFKLESIFTPGLIETDMSDPGDLRCLVQKSTKEC